MKKIGDAIALRHGKAMPNRFMLAPLTNLQSRPDGTLGDDEFNWLVKRAEGGFGLTMTCAAHVHPGGQGFPGQLGIWSDDHLPGLTRLAAGIKASRGLSSVQLHHAGRRGAADLTGGRLVCPWDDTKTGARALTTAEVEQSIEDFILAALRAERAGFDGVELHGAHGYLLGQFLDSEHNHRTDGYGGSLKDRQRVIFAVIDGIRERCGANFQLGLRLSPERYGIPLTEARATAQRAMSEGKIDYLDMSLWDVFKKPAESAYQGKPLIAHFTDLPRGECRLGVAGKIISAAVARACVEAGADIVIVGRGAILHHNFPQLVLADSAFKSAELPVSRDYLRQQGVGNNFIGYIESTWPDFLTN